MTYVIGVPGLERVTLFTRYRDVQEPLQERTPRSRLDVDLDGHRL